MLDVELLTAGGDVGRPERLVTFRTDQVETSEVIPLAQRVLSALVVFDGEELLRDNLVTVLMVSVVNLTGELTRQRKQSRW